MSKPLIIEIDFLLLTPAFLGDAGMMAALRPQSFKGLLRHWHRAIDSTLGGSDREREDRIWGGSEKGFGQSKVLLRIQSKNEPAKWKYNKNKFKEFDIKKDEDKFPFNGITYLGYPFDIRDDNKKRDALEPFTQFTLQGVIPAASNLKEGEIQAIIASFWLLAVLGSCGSRSRRGFGSLQPTGWRLQNDKPHPEWQKNFQFLPKPGQANIFKAWQEALANSLKLFREWFGPFPENIAHNHIGKNFRALILPGKTRWEEAMAYGGEKMQRFRRTYQPDYNNVKNFIKDPNNYHIAPEKTTFGLPLYFCFKNGEAIYYPVRPTSNADIPKRFTSMLYLKIIRLGMRYHPVYFLIDGMEPALDLDIRVELQTKQYDTKSPEKSAMQLFFAELIEENKEERR